MKPFIEKKITKKGKLKIIVHATPENPLIYKPTIGNSL